MNLGIESAYKFFDQAPVIIGYVRGENYVIEFANERLLEVWKVDNTVYGKSLFVVFPELEKQGFRHLLDNVRVSGNSFTAYEYPIDFERPGGTVTYYFDFIYKPYYENNEIKGVISVGHDVTEKVIAKKSVEREDKKWKELANSLPVMVWTADANGMVDFFNELWYKSTGLTWEETYGFGWTKALHPDDLKRCLEAWNYALAHHSFYEMEVRYRTKEGDYKWFIARGVPILENDTVISWYGTSSDITGQKNIEQQLEELVKGRTLEIEQKTTLLDNILKNSTNGISVSQLLFNEQGQVIDAQTILANDAAVKYIGLPKEDYLTKPASYFDPNIIASPYGQACIKTHKTGEPFIMRYFLDFSKKWLELTVSKMDDIHLIHHFTDVTSIREAEIKLEKTLEELRYSNANLEEFAYAASHDLKEPIRKAQYFINRLKEELISQLQPNHIELFDRLENSQNRMQNLVQDLLEYSQAAKGSIEKDIIDLNQTITSVLEDLELEVQRKNAVIKIGNMPSIVGNKRQIHQLFQNLIGNALKYNKQGLPPTIQVVARTINGKDLSSRVPRENHDKKFHLIQVADNGIGFNQKEADKIFMVFTRLHSSLHYKGSGIGLSIVRKVVESHNGYVWAESEPEKGARFNVVLPLANI